jgi:hypothetical protein
MSKPKLSAEMKKKADCAAHYLREALDRLEHPSRNNSGAPMQLGGVYWRLAKVMTGFVDPNLELFEGGHAKEIRRMHGRVVPVFEEDKADA